jgi:hypothetical protein
MKAHVREDDTPYTLAALRCDFGADIAVMVAGIMNTTTAVMTYGADAAACAENLIRPGGRSYLVSADAA